jgi:TP901 family phage tail tape measure protein
MPTLSELRVKGTYDGKGLKQGLSEAKADMQDAGRVIKAAADQAESSITAATTKIGAAYAKLPVEARKAYDAASEAQKAYADKITGSMTQIGLGMTLGLTAPFAMFAKQSIALSASVEQNLDVLQVSIGATEQQMKQLSATAIALGADMTLPATSAADAARAMTQLAKGGLEADDVLKAARGTMQLAAAAGIDAAEAATLQGRALASFSLKGEQATHVADLMAKSVYSATGTIQDLGYALQASSAVMHAAGQSIDDTITSLTLLAKAGITGSDAGTSLKSMFLRLEEGGSMKRVRDLLHGYGIEVYDASGKMKDMREVIAQFTPMMEHLTEKQRNAALGIIFGSDAIRAAQILMSGGAKAFDEMRVKLEQQGAAADLAAARNKGLAGALDGMKSAWETFMQQSADPIIRPLANMVRGVGEFIGTLSSMDPVLRNSILGIAAFGAVVGPATLAIAGMRNAWATLGAVRAAATAVTAATAASEAALAAAQGAAAVTAAEAAVAEGTLAVANEAVAVTAGQAAVGVVALEAGTGGLAIAMGILTGPIGLAIAAVVALTAAGYALYKLSQAEADQAAERERAFRNSAQAAYDEAKAKVKLQGETKMLLSEFLKLESQQHRNNEEAARYQKVSNDISLLMPSLVKGYRSQGDAILDVAQAHAEAARQAQNQYDKEMLLAKSKLSYMGMSDAANAAGTLRSQGAGMSMGQLDASVTWDNDSKGFKYNGIEDGPIAAALKNRKMYEIQRDRFGGSQEDVDNAKREELRVINEQNEQLRVALSEAAKLRRDANEEQKRAKLGPEGYAKSQQAAADKAEKEKWASEAQKRKDDAAYQKRHDAWFKAKGYEGIDELGKEQREGSAKAKAKKAADELTGALIEGIAKRIKTPEGQASCGFLAVEILKATGVQMNAKGYGGGAKDLVDRVRNAGGYEVGPGQSRPGDLVYFHGPQYGAMQANGKRSGYHVGVNEGGGYMTDSSGGNTHLHKKIMEGATFLRPARDGKYDKGDTIIHGLELYNEAAKKAEEAARALEDTFSKSHTAVNALSDAEAKYAEVLGVQLDVYKKLDDAHKKRAKIIYDQKSGVLTSKELARMSAGAASDAILDPTERALAQFKSGLSDRTDINEQDKLRLIDEKRKALQAERTSGLAKEVAKIQQEQQILEATTELERIRLRLLMDRPGIKPEELKALSEAEFSKYQAGANKAAADEMRGKQATVEAAKLEAEHAHKLYDIQDDMALGEEARYRLIQDENDALEHQLFLLEQQARVQRGEITPAQAKALEDAEAMRAEHSRSAKDQVHNAEVLRGAQDKSVRKRAEDMDILEQKAQAKAEGLANILMRPLEDGLGKGVKGFMNSLVDGWRQTVRQMFLDWAKSGLMRALSPMMEGRDVRSFRAERAAKEQQDAAAQALILKATKSSIREGDENMVYPGSKGGLGNIMSLVGLFGNLFKHRSPVPFLGTGVMAAAAGGSPSFGNPVMVGEFGPELWTPPSSGGRIHTTGQTSAMMSGGTTIHVTQNITTPDASGFRRSSRQIASQAAEALGRESRRRG